MKTTKTTARSLTAAFTLTGLLVGGAMGGELLELDAAVPSTQSSMFEKGDWLLSFSGSYNKISSEGDSVDFLYASIDASYFFNDNWSIGMSTFGILLPEGDTVEDTGYAIGLEPNLKYYFQNSSKYTPYVGVHTGFAYGFAADDSETITTYGAHAGILFPLTESAYFDAKLKWTDYNTTDSSDLDLNALQLLVGFKLKF